MWKISKVEPSLPVLRPRKKVAAYARVSMETERLMHSLSAQVSYYSGLIQKNPDWEYAGVYSDDGVSGTGTAKRSGFRQMVEDCEKGKIDIVLTKSISRFARNTVDLLDTVRHLKDLGVEVRFEKEHISSMSGDGELMLTILASFAQEESRSISDNVKWGTRKRFEQGIPNGRFRVYGYRWEGDRLVIEPEEAKVVKRIFQNFLDGKSRLETEREFAAEGITTAQGCRWVDSNIKVVLTNITYTGNLLLQKEYIEDPITKKRKKNKGELPQYYVEGTHEAIIDMETFRYVQEEMARRKEMGPFANKALNTTCFTSMLKCGKCGCSFVRSQRENRAKGSTTYGDTVVYWVCSTTKRKGGRCSTKDIPEPVLRKTCAEAMGLGEFDEDIFKERISAVIVGEGRKLHFYFKDGMDAEIVWQSTAKKDCWTEEHKDRQRGWMREYMAGGNGRYSSFTTRIKCEHCGFAFRRQSQPCKSSPTGKMGYWRCGMDKKSGKGCRTKGIREDRLMGLTAKVMGTPEFDGDAFRAQVGHISVSTEMALTYHFLDGHEESVQYDFRYQGRPWTEEQRAKFKESIKGTFTEERRRAMSEKMKKIRSEKYWVSTKR